MVTYEDRPVTRRWVICENCGHSQLYLDSKGWWGVECDVCGKEGCVECLDHDTFWVDGREYHHHKTCKLTKKLQKLKDNYEWNVRLSDLAAVCNSEPDHIC